MLPLGLKFEGLVHALLSFGQGYSTPEPKPLKAVGDPFGSWICRSRTAAALCLFTVYAGINRKPLSPKPQTLHPKLWPLRCGALKRAGKTTEKRGSQGDAECRHSECGSQRLRAEQPMAAGSTGFSQPVPRP